jgi:hypothetical protein
MTAPDAAILSALVCIRAGHAELEGKSIEWHQDDANAPEYDRLLADLNRNEDEIRQRLATTPAGVAAQLWCALSHSFVHNGPVQAANTGDLAFFTPEVEATLDRGDKLILAALRSLEAMEPAPAASADIAATFKAWSLAELAAHYAERCPDEVMDRLTGEALRLPEALGKLPAANTHDLLLKVFPLLMARYEPHGDEPPLVPAYEYKGDGSRDLLDAVNDDLRRLVPEIAEAMAAPHRDQYRAKGGAK